MKKTIYIILSLIIIIILFSSCQTLKEPLSSATGDNTKTTPVPTTTHIPAPTTTTVQTPSVRVFPVEDYTVLLYQNAAGGSADKVTTKYTGEDFYKTETFKKSDIVAQKQVDVCGKNFIVGYLDSTKFPMYKDEFDSYAFSHDNEIILINYNSVTGKSIYYYVRTSTGTDRSYKSDVSPQSSEEEFLEYVKKILLEQAGVSVENRQIKTVTAIIKEDGKKEYENKFVNYSDVDPNFNAEYRYTFYSTIDGISRVDDIEITITNVGEICSYNARENADAYRPFENVKIDKEMVISKVKDNFSEAKSSFYYPVDSYEINSLCVLPDESALWVEAIIYYKYHTEDVNLSSAVRYLIKVAEISESKITE